MFFIIWSSSTLSAAEIFKLLKFDYLSVSSWARSVTRLKKKTVLNEIKHFPHCYVEQETIFMPLGPSMLQRSCSKSSAREHKVHTLFVIPTHLGTLESFLLQQLLFLFAFFVNFLLIILKLILQILTDSTT